jgi:hypothetical protein
MADVAFWGRGYEHAIDISAGTGSPGFVDVRAARGEIVGLRLDPAGCHVFPDEAHGGLAGFIQTAMASFPGGTRSGRGGA